MTQNVGDIHSNTKGSGARYNAGKVPFDLLPLNVVSDMYKKNLPLSDDLDLDAFWAVEVLHHIADFQAGDDSALESALVASAFGEPDLNGFELAARVFEYGKKKYAAWNWAKGMQWSVPIGCIVRHIQKILNGEKTDDESGIHHMGHIQCNLFMLAHYMNNYKEGDDRPVEWFGGSVCS